MSVWSLVAAAACWVQRPRISRRAVDEIAPLTLLPIQLAVSVSALLVASLLAPGELSAVGVASTSTGVGACAVYTVISSRYLGTASTLGVVLLQQAAAFAFAVVLFVGAVVFDRAGSLDDVSAMAWIGALTTGALYYGWRSGSTCVVCERGRRRSQGC